MRHHYFDKGKSMHAPTLDTKNPPRRSTRVFLALGILALAYAATGCIEVSDQAMANAQARDSMCGYLSASPSGPGPDWSAFGYPKKVPGSTSSWP